MDWYLKVLKNYVGFRGRARRKEYWILGPTCARTDTLTPSSYCCH